LIPGDGIGQETASAVKTIFKAANVPVDWEQFDVSGYTSADDTTFKQSVESLRRNKVGLKGILYTPVSSLGHSSFNVTIRKDLDMYASLVLCKNIPGYPTRHEGVDFAIIRENTEGEYSGLEHQSYPGVVESLKVITRTKSERIARFAFDFALRNNRKKVTCIHKANIMKLADGLFLNTCREVSKEYASSGIKFDDMIVDNASMQLVSKPQQFDVMVMPNLYGNIVSNVGAGLVGGPGIVPGCNIGREYAMFEPVSLSSLFYVLLQCHVLVFCYSNCFIVLISNHGFQWTIEWMIIGLPSRRKGYPGTQHCQPLGHDPLVGYDAPSPRSR
jgi:isocitrate dehydrogenase (NAD+)